jgi:hypothetical protein
MLRTLVRSRMAVLRSLQSNSRSAVARLGPPVVAASGPGAIERLEIQHTNNPRVPILVFVHGGAWRGGRIIAHDSEETPESNARITNFRIGPTGGQAGELPARRTTTISK